MYLVLNPTHLCPFTTLDQVTSCCFSPRGGMQILTCSRDNKLKLLDARTLEVEDL